MVFLVHGEAILSSAPCLISLLNSIHRNLKNPPWRVFPFLDGIFLLYCIKLTKNGWMITIDEKNCAWGRRPCGRR